MDFLPMSGPLMALASSKGPFNNHLYWPHIPGSSSSAPNHLLPQEGFSLTSKCLVPHYKDQSCGLPASVFSSFIVGNGTRITSTFSPEVTKKIDFGWNDGNQGLGVGGKKTYCLMGTVSDWDHHNLLEMYIGKSVPKIFIQVLCVAHQKGD